MLAATFSFRDRHSIPRSRHIFRGEMPDGRRAGTGLSPVDCRYMARENEKRTEWERLLLSHRAPLSGDLPEQLRKLLEELDERLRSGRAPDAG
jgi:hypothetical protein